jgi:predicted peroxiredoxin
MTISKRQLLALSAVFLVSPAAVAQQSGAAKSSLFINMTSDDGHRLLMGLGFGLNQMKRGHKITVFLNDRAVSAASQKNAAKYSEQQKIIADLQAGGATVLVCPMCSKHYGVDASDYLPGLKPGNPELTGDALFADNAKSLTW